MHALKRTGFRLERFEYLVAADDVVLLRIAGTWDGEPPACELVASGNGERLTLEPLPQPPGSGERTWRAAYSAPQRLIRHRSTLFELLPSGGAPARLPRPVEHSATPSRPRRFPALDGLRAARARAREDRAAELVRELEREREARAAAQMAAEELRAALQETTAERSRLFAWMETNAAERARLQEALAGERARVERESARAVAEAHSLAEGRAAAVKAIERRLARTRTDLAAARQHGAEALDRERERSRSALAALRRDLADANEQNAALARRADADRSELERVTAELSETRTVAEGRLRGLKAAERRIAQAREHADRERAGRVSTAQRAERAERTAATRRQEADARTRAEHDEAAANRERVAALESLVARLRSGIEAGERRLAEAEAQAEAVRSTIATAAAKPAAGGSADTLRQDLDQRLERLYQLERQAVALRDEIHARLGTAPPADQARLFAPA